MPEVNEFQPPRIIKETTLFPEEFEMIAALRKVAMQVFPSIIDVTFAWVTNGEIVLCVKRKPHNGINPIHYYTFSRLREKCLNYELGQQLDLPPLESASFHSLVEESMRISAAAREEFEASFAARELDVWNLFDKERRETAATLKREE
ncbi:MAG: hypothetical protein PHO48_02365 [Candidatus Gracilibacteria bacterium]|nr:hypothetical protein [Candidatus Gracilibacteria bacterium]MDD5179199.1 hypothetical protein [Candidatus Gracilibacteria bacterium]